MRKSIKDLSIPGLRNIPEPIPDLIKEANALLARDRQGRTALAAAAFKGTFSLVSNEKALEVAARARVLVSALISLLQDYAIETSKPVDESTLFHVSLLLDTCVTPNALGLSSLEAAIQQGQDQASLVASEGAKHMHHILSEVEKLPPPSSSLSPALLLSVNTLIQPVSRHIAISIPTSSSTSSSFSSSSSSSSSSSLSSSSSFSSFSSSSSLSSALEVCVDRASFSLHYHRLALDMARQCRVALIDLLNFFLSPRRFFALLPVHPEALDVLRQSHTYLPNSPSAPFPLLSSLERGLPDAPILASRAVSLLRGLLKFHAFLDRDPAPSSPLHTFSSPSSDDKKRASTSPTPPVGCKEDGQDNPQGALGSPSSARRPSSPLVAIAPDSAPYNAALSHSAPPQLPAELPSVPAGASGETSKSSLSVSEISSSSADSLGSSPKLSIGGFRDSLPRSGQTGAPSQLSAKDALLMASFGEMGALNQQRSSTALVVSDIADRLAGLKQEAKQLRSHLAKLQAEDEACSQSIHRVFSTVSRVVATTTPKDMATLISDFQVEEKAPLSRDADGACHLILAHNGLPKAGTLIELVSMLTHPKFYSSQFVSAFMLTYRAFTSPEVLLGLLFARWALTPEEITALSKKETPLSLPELPQSPAADGAALHSSTGVTTSTSAGEIPNKISRKSLSTIGWVLKNSAGPQDHQKSARRRSVGKSAIKRQLTTAGLASTSTVSSPNLTQSFSSPSSSSSSSSSSSYSVPSLSQSAHPTVSYSSSSSSTTSNSQRPTSPIPISPKATGPSAEELLAVADGLLKETPRKGFALSPALEVAIWRGSFSLVYNTEATAMAAEVTAFLKNMALFLQNLESPRSDVTPLLRSLVKASQPVSPADPRAELEVLLANSDPQVNEAGDRIVALIRECVPHLRPEPRGGGEQAGGSTPESSSESGDISDNTRLSEDAQEGGQEQGVLWQKQIRLRIVAVLKLWLRDFWSDFELSSKMTSMLLTWLQKSSSDEFFRAVCDTLNRTLVQKLTSSRSEDALKSPMTRDSFPPVLIPKEILRAPPEDLDPFSLDHTELARQLSLVDQSLFREILPKELLNQNWNRPNKKVSAPHVSELVARVNATASWVMNSIVVQSEKKNRVKLVEKWIRVAGACLDLNNLNGVMTILSGLGGPCIDRLKHTWARVDPTLLQRLEQMRVLMSPSQNYAAYRTYLKQLNPPCVPYIGSFLTDLTAIDESMPTYQDEAQSVINFAKFLRTSELLSTFIYYQNPPYNLTPISFIQHQLITKWLDQSKLYPVETLFAISRVLES